MKKNNRINQNPCLIAVAILAKKISIANVNSTCWYLACQNKIPSGLDLYKKK
ncbi:hypothetical protein IMSAGC013_02276 [Lachnospiraceae bacterium]|jgi:cyclic lactone autoinducer peptide|nr:hypothetical protein IMSAGC013_02276 [Lachnospiraceae bacterium]